MAQPQSGGHAGATPVAMMDKIYPGPGGYWAEGDFLDPTMVPEVPKAMYMMQKKAVGPSVDLDRDYTVQAMPHPTRPDKKVGMFTEFNIIGATLVPMPAFYQVHMCLVDPNEQEKSLLASAGVDFSQFFTDPEAFANEFGMEELLGDMLGGPPAPDAADGAPAMPIVILGSDDASAPAPSILGPSAAAGVSKFAPAQMGLEGATTVASILQKLLFCHTDFFLALKHAHWNVVGDDFISVHRLIDEWADMAEGMADDCAERVATLGASPTDCAAAIVANRPAGYADYTLGKSDTQNHLRMLDGLFTNLATEIRGAITATQGMDPISQNMLLGHGEKLEHQQWFLRAHLENNAGELS
jgi:starvation-inducible DNA-binding protein